MKELLVVQNVTREKLGLLEPVLAERGIGYDLVDLDGGETFPSPFGRRAVIVLGGPDSANENTDKMINELARVKDTLAAGIPYLGICLGLQVGAKAAGGQVVRGKHKETGFLDPNGDPYTVKLTDAGKKDPLFAGLGDELRVFHLHGETVELTDKMVLLGAGTWCHNQIVKLGERAYGIQSHFEQTETMLRVLAAADEDLVPIGPGTLMDQFHAAEPDYTRIGKKLFHNFFDIAGL
jgi:GMP synthase (glutamine-hydrolysing)